MDILSMLMQLCSFGCGGCGTSTAAETATAASNALCNMGGLGNILTMICRLFGLGC